MTDLLAIDKADLLVIDKSRVELTSNGDLLVLQFSTSEDSISNWGSALIRRMCHSPFSHIDLVLPDGNLLGASDHPDAPVVSGNPRGVAIRPPGYQPFGTRRQMIIRTKRAEAIRSAIMSQLGAPFDSSALLDFISDAFPGLRDWRDSGTWFCAELIIWGFETGSYWAPKSLLWPKNRVSPTDIFLIFMFDPNWLNRDEFWSVIPGLKLGNKER